MSWHQIDCLASRVRDRDGIEKPFHRTGFRTGVVQGRSVHVDFVPSSNWWIVGGFRGNPDRGREVRSDTYDRVWHALVAAVPDIYRDVAKGKDTPSLIADEVMERVVQAICGDRFADPWAASGETPTEYGKAT